MLGNLLLFSGRMGRLQYFLWRVILVPILTALALRMLVVPASGSPPESADWAGLLLVYGLSFWTGFSLEAARIRDIGWRPGLTIFGLLAINGVILAIDFSFPVWSAQTHFFGIFSTVINSLAAGLFLLMPSVGDSFIPRFSSAEASRDLPRQVRPEPPVRRSPFQAMPVSSQPTYPREKVPFGRRGVT